MTDATMVGGLFVVVGLALLLGVGWLYLQAQASLAWASTAGEILTAEMEGGEGGGANSSRLVVTYSYHVGERTLQGHRITFGDRIWKWRQARSAVRAEMAKYPPGSRVTVWYDPRHPEHCTLNTGMRDPKFMPTVVVAGILTLAGVAAMFGWIKVRG